MPKVSALVPTYNCAAYLPKALDSALAQTFDDLEVIVIDDGSTDNTREIVERYQQANPGKIVYIYQKNQGISFARNAGMRISRGEYFALLDADDQWLPDHLKESVAVLEANPGAGVVHSNITFIRENGEAMETPVRRKEFLSGQVFRNIFLRDADISCPTVVFRKACCDKVGLFDEQLSRLGCEDRELWLRIAQHYPFAYIDKVLALYLVRSSSVSRNMEKMIKARMYVVDKFCPPGADNKLRRLALGKIHHELGDTALFSRNFTLALQEYFRSITFVPCSFRTWVNLLKALLRIKVKGSRKNVPQS